MGNNNAGVCKAPRMTKKVVGIKGGKIRNIVSETLSKHIKKVA
jgi:hypothetical protein